jgi:molecular chaperone GrpE
MSKTNGRADAGVDEQQQKQMHEHENELPLADPADGFEEKISPAGEAQAAGPSAAGASADDDVQKLRAERDNLFDRLARLQAEFDNFRKRSAKENADFRDFAVADAARALLPVIDNFSLALKSSVARPEDLRKGVELIYKQLQDMLQKMNVQRIPAQGEPFDPNVHEAIEMVESNEVPDHHVLEELQPGYRIKGRLLRPAMVRVAKKIV